MNNQRTESGPTVAGESARAILSALAQMERGPSSDGLTTLSIELPTEELAPTSRALMRIEAELLSEDAEHWIDGRSGERTDDQRRFDAFILLAQRTGEALGV